MKKYWYLFVVLIFFGCTSNQPIKKEKKSPEIPKVSYGNFGKQITETGFTDAIAVKELLKDKDSSFVKVKGLITESCKHSGCWMDINLGNNKIMHITFKDDNFAIPLDAQNKTAIFEGKAYREITANDKQKDTIYSFIAEGVIIK